VLSTIKLFVRFLEYWLLAKLLVKIYLFFVNH